MLFEKVAGFAMQRHVAPCSPMHFNCQAPLTPEEHSGHGQVNDAKPGLPLEGLFPAPASKHQQVRGVWYMCAARGITMVFTGEMEAIDRKEAEEKAKAAGAKAEAV